MATLRGDFDPMIRACIQAVRACLLGPEQGAVALASATALANGMDLREGTPLRRALQRVHLGVDQVQGLFQPAPNSG
jgi:hypothetical protein